MDLLTLLSLLSQYVPERWRPAVPGLVALWVVYCLVISRVNAMVRAGAEAGKTYTRRSLAVLGFLNLPAVNPDKAIQFLRGYRGPSQAPGSLPTPPRGYADVQALLIVGLVLLAMLGFVVAIAAAVP